VLGKTVPFDYVEDIGLRPRYRTGRVEDVGQRPRFRVQGSKKLVDVGNLLSTPSERIVVNSLWHHICVYTY
jgi:hypothetical protein